MTLDVVTWRDAILSLGAGVLLAATAPQAIMAATGWSDPALVWALALLCGISGKSMVVRLAQDPMALIERILGWR